MQLGDSNRKGERFCSIGGRRGVGMSGRASFKLAWGGFGGWGGGLCREKENGLCLNCFLW